MKKVTVTICCLVAVLFGHAIDSSGAMAERYEYVQATGAKQEVFDWRLLLSNSATVISENGDERFVNYCTLNGETTRWEMKKGESAVVAERQGKTIHLNGSLDGQEIEKSCDIDEMPWYQPLSFSLREFVHSQKDAVEFWMIRPDNLEPVKMQAKRQSIETIEVNGCEEKAVRVEVRLTGLLSAFWSCHYWFRQEDGVFLKYEGVHGPPGTPKTVIEQLSRQ